MYWSQLPKKFPAVTVLILIIVTSSPAATVTYCFQYEDPTVWEIIERMSVDQLAGTLILFGFLVLLAITGISRGREVFRAVKQTRAYESRALTALFYNRVEEAVSVCALFPSSPVAAVVIASVQQSPTKSIPGGLLASKAAFQRAVVAQTISLRRGLWMLAAIGWTSPAIGLATMLAPFTHYSSGPPLPFCLSLMIAAPALWLHKALIDKVDVLLIETDRVSLSIIEQIDEQTLSAIDKHNNIEA